MGRFWSERVPVIGALVLLTMTGCASPQLQLAANPSPPAVTLAQAGVRLTLIPQDWHAFPHDLPEYYTPIRVLIQNDRSDEIQVRYQDFAAVDAAGSQYAAVRPTEVAQALTRAAASAAAADWALADGDMWRDRWALDLPYDSFYYPLGYPSFTDLLSRGLQEGPALPGALVQGFLYLQPVSHRGPLTLVWRPRLASGQSLPQFSAPLRVVR